MTQAEQDALLLELGGLIRKELSAIQMLERFVDVMAGQLNADRGTVYLLDENGTELISIAAHLPEMNEIRVPLGQGVAGYVARTGRIANIPNGGDALPIWREIDQQTGYTTHSMLAGPLYNAKKQLIGVIQLLNKQEGTFDRKDEEIFLALSKQTATLLEETTLSPRPDYIGDKHNKLTGDTPTVVLPMHARFNRIIGTSAPMRQVLEQIHRVASTDASVLLRGESGTGKGLIARAIHHNSERHDAPLVHVDCTTLPEGLMENELFGHEKGAYTGAHSREAGKVEAAHGGTLFLDEIGDLPLQLQGKLLTLIQEKTFRRVGGTQLQHADIRIVTATNRPLEQLVQLGQFREDLYYRLRVVQLVLPPLRERGQDDLLRLINHFVAEASKRHKRPIQRIHPDALERLLQYPWPGNVRELENCIESAVIFSDDEMTLQSLPLAAPHSGIPHSLGYPNAGPSYTPPPQSMAYPPNPYHPQAFGPSHTPSPPSAYPPQPQTGGHTAFSQTGGHAAFSQTGGHVAFPQTGGHAAFPQTDTNPFRDEPSLKELEAQYIRYLLTSHHGNRSACARVLGIGRNTLLRKMKEYGIE